MRPFEDLVSDHGVAVLRTCRALLPQPAADDAWSETFLAAMRSYPNLDHHSNVRGWLVTIAHRKALDQIRGERAELSRKDASGRERHPVVAAPEAWEVDPEIVDAVRSLPFKQRGAVAYRYLADLPYSEVAALLDCSQAAARRSAADGIASLRRRLAGGAAR